MKIAVIGAAGVRTPLLIHGLSEIASECRIEEIHLYDIDQQRLNVMGRVAQAMAKSRGLAARLEVAASIDSALDGASAVISSIRVGGTAARVLDEQLALKHGLVGQETVGAGGFACATRNLKAMLGYARKMEERAPKATLINFTNPVGILSQGLLNHSSVKVLGVCDTPLETFETIAAALDRDPFELEFDYFGLNHLGWIRGVRDREGHELLPQLLQSPDRLQRCYRHSLFPPEFLQKLELLPTEYLYFYYFPEKARSNTQKSGRSRGQLIEELTSAFFHQIAAAEDSNLVPLYEQYLRDRNASYFSIEVTAGKHKEEDRPLYSQFSGYERIAVMVLKALQSDDPVTIPLTVRNGEAIGDLDPQDAVEIPCLVSRNGAIAKKRAKVPPQVRELLLQVKEYERLTVAAVTQGSMSQARAALERNPLVGEGAGSAVLADYVGSFGAQMGL